MKQSTSSKRKLYSIVIITFFLLTNKKTIRFGWFFYFDTVISFLLSRLCTFLSFQVHYKHSSKFFWRRRY